MACPLRANSRRPDHLLSAVSNAAPGVAYSIAILLDPSMVGVQYGRPVVDLYGRMVSLRRLTMLPNAPFNWLNLYPRAQVRVHPLTSIQLPARELKGYDLPFVNQT